MVIADKDDLIADGVDGLRVSTSIVGAAVDGLENIVDDNIVGAKVEDSTVGATVDGLE